MILGLDFDGVLATEPPAEGYRMPQPASGLHQILSNLARQHTLICFTARAVDPAGRRSVEDWLKYYGLSGFIHTVTAIKLPFIELFIDDRGYRFTSWDQTLADLPRVLASTRPARSRGSPPAVYAGSTFG